MRFENVSEYLKSGFRPAVVVIGTGPAGMSLAERLASHGVPSLLVEAGGYDGSAESQDFYRGTVIGDHYLDLHACRLRQFGGSSGCWSGWCRPLDEDDFLPRPDVPHTGWPIRHSDLAPYDAPASAYLRTTVRPPDRALTPDLDQIGFAFSPPVRLGFERRSAIEQSERIGLLTNTPVVELVPVNGRIESLVVVESGARRRTLPVPIVCLCTGGIENSRLLLWSNRQHQGGVVPKAETLGRFWMEHPVYPIGDAVTQDGIARDREQRKYFAPSREAKKRLGILGAHLNLLEVEHPDGMARELVREAMCMAPGFFDMAYETFGREFWCGHRMYLEWEQTPHPENRVELGTEVDANGMPRTRLYWRKGEIERRTAFEMVRLYGEMLVKAGLGRARYLTWLEENRDYPIKAQTGGPHHMGGTRMAESPATGIVDRDCRVFGVDNLYIGGSSVFTTGGHANPTFTIVQLALRLADHLRDRVPAA